MENKNAVHIHPVKFENNDPAVIIYEQFGAVSGEDTTGVVSEQVREDSDKGVTVDCEQLEDGMNGHVNINCDLIGNGLVKV